jgi:hypothetical protein
LALLGGIKRGITDLTRGIAAGSGSWPQAFAQNRQLELQRERMESEQDYQNRVLAQKVAEEEVRRSEADEQRGLIAEKQDYAREEKKEAQKRLASRRLLDMALASGDPDALNLAWSNAELSGVLPSGIEDRESFIKTVLETDNPYVPLPTVPGVFYRTGPKGDIQFSDARHELGIGLADDATGDPAWQLFPGAGYYITKSGKAVQLDPDFVAAIKEHQSQAKEDEGLQIHTINKATGRIYLNNKTYIDIPRIEGVDGIDIEPGDLNNVFDAAVLALKNTALETVREDTRIRLGNLGMGAEDIEEKMLAWNASFATRQFNLEFSEAQEALLNASNELQMASDLALHMLQDQEVRDNIGLVVGLSNRAIREITGKESDDPKLTRFLTHIKNVKDKLLIRQRSGAAISPTEVVTYDDILGSDITDIVALEEKLNYMIYYENESKRSLYEQEYLRKNEQITDEFRSYIPRYRRRNWDAVDEITFREKAEQITPEDVMIHGY